MKKKVVLIGTGISGLSCLYFFLKKNAQKIRQVEIFEKEMTIGGVLAHTEKNGFLFEHGAQGVLSSRTQFSALVSELNLTQNISRVEFKKAKRAFFFKNKTVNISPKNILQMFHLNLIPIFTVIRVLREYFFKKKTDDKNQTVEEFFSRHFGQTFTRHFVAPIMKGIWGGGASRILMRCAFPNLHAIEQKHQSILKYFFKNAQFTKNQTKKEMLSFEQGMLTFPKALLKEIQILCEKENVHFTLKLNSHYSLIKRDTNDLVLYSGQPWKDENFFLDPAVQAAINVLNQIPTHSLIVVGIGSPNKDIQNRLDGFGALAVENNSEGVLGMICVHSLNPNHVPSDSFLYRIIMGGESMSSAIDFESCSDAQILQLAKQYLQKYQLLLHKEQTYAFEHVVRHINYLPLPTEHQEKVMQAVSDLEKHMSGVFLVGNYLMGPAIDTCITAAHHTAEKMSQYLSPNEK